MPPPRHPNSVRAPLSRDRRALRARCRRRGHVRRHHTYHSAFSYNQTARSASGYAGASPNNASASDPSRSGTDCCGRSWNGAAPRTRRQAADAGRLAERLVRAAPPYAGVTLIRRDPRGIFIGGPELGVDLRSFSRPLVRASQHLLQVRPRAPASGAPLPPVPSRGCANRRRELAQPTDALPRPRSVRGSTSACVAAGSASASAQACRSTSWSSSRKTTVAIRQRRQESSLSELESVALGEIARVVLVAFPILRFQSNPIGRPMSGCNAAIRRA